MRTAVLIPSRGDRPEFLTNAVRMVCAQTHQPNHVQIMDYAPETLDYDITERYRKGYEILKHDYDLIFFWEDDDYYHPEYLETMIAEWYRRGQPDLLGIDYTIYFHLRLWKHFTMYHKRRASTMSTVIKGGLLVQWPLDIDPFPDVHLWLNNHHLSKSLFTPDMHLTVGIKHGTGKTVANGHHTDPKRMLKFEHLDNGFLRSTLDKESYEFYERVAKELDREERRKEYAGISGMQGKLN